MSRAQPFGGQILALVTRNLLGVAEAEGLDPAELLAAAGLSHGDLTRADAYLPIERHVALGRAMAERLGAVNGGLHSGAAIYGDPRGALGFAIRRSGTHARALEHFVHFIAITNDSLELALERHADGISLSVEMISALAQLGHPTEALFSAWVSIARFATTVRWAPLRVTFRHPARGSTAEHRDFFGCPVEFAAPRSLLTITARSLELPIAPVEHPFDAVLDRMEQRLYRQPRSDEPGAAGGSAPPAARLLAELRKGRLESLAAHSPALLSEIGLLLLSGEASLPAFETAFLLGFPSVRELTLAVAR
jgi:hypothetical protein